MFMFDDGGGSSEIDCYDPEGLAWINTQSVALKGRYKNVGLYDEGTLLAAV